MSESTDKSDAEEAAALVKAIGILWNAMPDDAKEQVRQQHSDVADAAEDVGKLLREQESKAESGQQGGADSPEQGEQGGN